ncbi:hypothetical protein IFM89_035666 [Coptis chinensis]|uniref:RNA polymerase I-specific transcription initiation factor RRN3 n=1 Tax=Coptis chinensis TaxID=261450 RepID=A0A835IRU0_9MAGN|nr:hypothetical protein IFM89_035666 [Coptis chinensis]
MGMELNSNYSNITEDNKMEEEEEEEEYTDSEIVLFVRDALKSVTNTDDENYTDHYSQLIGVLNSTKRYNPDQVASLVTSLRALSRVTSYIDSYHHGSLLDSIFDIKMWDYGTDVMDALMELIVSLSASGYVVQCLHMLVKSFTPPKSFLPLLSQPRGIAKKKEVLDRVHSALKEIADLVPLAPTTLQFRVLELMPHITNENEVYVENMLRLESGVFGTYLGKEILRAVIYRLVELDVSMIDFPVNSFFYIYIDQVEIEWEYILLDDPGRDIFNMELEDIDEDAEYADGNEGRQWKLQPDVCAEKLDRLMVFETLLTSFETAILPAHKSKFAQFVIFYACSLDPEVCGEIFAKKLYKSFVYGATPLIRMSAVAYLASYLARGRFLPSDLVVSTLESLADWCSKYCKSQAIQEKSMNPELHKVFYSGCQAVMYVLCFRMRSIMDLPHLKSQLLCMPLEDILWNPLNPLKVCLPSIVNEFRLQAKAARLFAVAERFIRPNFIYWSLANFTREHGENDEDGGSDDDDDNCSSEEDVRESGMGMSYDGHEHELDAFENSIRQMSITPNISVMHNMPARLRPSTSPESL